MDTWREHDSQGLEPGGSNTKAHTLKYSSTLRHSLALWVSDPNPSEHVLKIA